MYLPPNSFASPVRRWFATEEIESAVRKFQREGAKGIVLDLRSNPGGLLNSAVAVELFHNAFLIHDDVQDESESRRGGPTRRPAAVSGFAARSASRVTPATRRRRAASQD